MSTHERIHDVVRSIPPGEVATYGQVAREAGLPGRARLVGYALAALGRGGRPGGAPPLRADVPWHRVLNARGEVSPRAGGDGEHLQRRLLEAEGVRFDRRGRVDLARYGWRP